MMTKIYCLILKWAIVSNELCLFAYHLDLNVIQNLFKNGIVSAYYFVKLDFIEFSEIFQNTYCII